VLFQGAEAEAVAEEEPAQKKNQLRRRTSSRDTPTQW